MINLECFEYNHLLLRVYRDERNRLIWFLKDDILFLFGLKGRVLPDIPKEFEIQLEVSVSLDSIPNLSENPKEVSVKTFISYAGLRFISSKSKSSQILDWIDYEVMTGKGKKIYLVENNDNLEDKEDKPSTKTVSQIFKLSNNSIELESIVLSEGEVFSNWFYKELLCRLNTYDNQREVIELGITLIIRLIEENKLKIVNSEGIELDNLSVKGFETYKFLKKIRLSIEGFLKDYK